MKPILYISVLLLSASSLAEDNKIQNVKTITLESDNSHIVHCANETKGIISQEETNICVFSKENNKNRCDDEDNWTVAEAAKFICD